MDDVATGALVLTAQDNWHRASVRVRIAAWLFGTHAVFEHMDYRLRIGWWRGQPYLLSISEVAR